MVHGKIVWVFHAIAVKTLKLCGIIIKATSVHDERPRTRTELPARIVFHVTLTSVDSYRCDSHCLARLFENLPAPPKHYGVFDVLPVRKVFAEAENLGSHYAKASDDRFPPQSKQILAKISQVRPMPNASIFSGSILDTEPVNFGFLKHTTRGHFNSQQ